LLWELFVQNAVIKKIAEDMIQLVYQDVQQTFQIQKISSSSKKLTALLNFTKLKKR